MLPFSTSMLKEWSGSTYIRGVGTNVRAKTINAAAPIAFARGPGRVMSFRGRMGQSEQYDQHGEYEPAGVEGEESTMSNPAVA